MTWRSLENSELLPRYRYARITPSLQAVSRLVIVGYLFIIYLPFTIYPSHLYFLTSIRRIIIVHYFLPFFLIIYKSQISIISVLYLLEQIIHKFEKITKFPMYFLWHVGVSLHVKNGTVTKSETLIKGSRQSVPRVY